MPTSIAFALLIGTLGLALSAQGPSPQPPTAPPGPAASPLSQLPAPPPGFAWQAFKNAALLRPEQWHEASMEGAQKIPIHTYAISPEAFSLERPFEMGLTLQIIDHPLQNGKVDASRAAMQYLRPFYDAHKKPGEVLLFDQKQQGEFELTFFRYRDARPGQKTIVVHKFILASKRSDSVHVFTFESPEATWEDNWARFGTPIFKMPIVFSNMPINVR